MRDTSRRDGKPFGHEVDAVRQFLAVGLGVGTFRLELVQAFLIEEFIGQRDVACG
jgi:hypothetical protein